MPTAPIEFEKEDRAKLLRLLDRDHAPDSQIAFGERVAAATLSKSKQEIKEILRKMDGKVGPALFALLEQAEQALQTRHDLVQAAYVRLLYAGDELLEEIEEKKKRAGVRPKRRSKSKRSTR